MHIVLSMILPVRRLGSAWPVHESLLLLEKIGTTEGEYCFLRDTYLRTADRFVGVYPVTLGAARAETGDRSRVTGFCIRKFSRLLYSGNISSGFR